MNDDGVIFEFVAIGKYCQVRAIDPNSGIEVAVTTPVNAARSDQMRLARNALKRALQNTKI